MDSLHVIHVALRVYHLLLEVGIIGLRPPLDKGLEGLLVLVPLLEFLVCRAFLDLRHSGITAGTMAGLGRGLLTSGALRGILLPLAALGRAASGRGRRRRRSSGWCAWNTVVVMHTPHVVPEVPLPGESASGIGAIAPFIGAEERLVAVAMHGVSLALMAEKAGCAGEARVLARFDLAPIGLQVGVHEFAAPGVAWLVCEGRKTRGCCWGAQSLTRSCT